MSASASAGGKGHYYSCCPDIIGKRERSQSTDSELTNTSGETTRYDHETLEKRKKVRLDRGQTLAFVPSTPVSDEALEWAKRAALNQLAKMHTLDMVPSAPCSDWSEVVQLGSSYPLHSICVVLMGLLGCHRKSDSLCTTKVRDVEQRMEVQRMINLSMQNHDIMTKMLHDVIHADRTPIESECFAYILDGAKLRRLFYDRLLLSLEKTFSGDRDHRIRLDDEHPHDYIYIRPEKGISTLTPETNLLDFMYFNSLATRVLDEEHQGFCIEIKSNWLLTDETPCSCVDMVPALRRCAHCDDTGTVHRVLSEAQLNALFQQDHDRFKERGHVAMRACSAMCFREMLRLWDIEEMTSRRNFSSMKSRRRA